MKSVGDWLRAADYRVRYEVFTSFPLPCVDTGVQTEEPVWLCCFSKRAICWTKTWLLIADEKNPMQICLKLCIHCWGDHQWMAWNIIKLGVLVKIIIHIRFHIELNFTRLVRWTLLDLCLKPSSQSCAWLSSGGKLQTLRQKKILVRTKVCQTTDTVPSCYYYILFTISEIFGITKYRWLFKVASFVQIEQAQKTLFGREGK